MLGGGFMWGEGTEGNCGDVGEVQSVVGAGRGWVRRQVLVWLM
jgi:hypothetical protein